MKLIAKIFVMLFILTLSAPPVAADNQPSVPDNSWEQRPEGIALAMILTVQKIEPKKASLHVYIKNTSDAVKAYSDYGIDSGIEIFYINESERLIPLHDYSLKNGGIVQGLREAREIKLGDFLTFTIDLTPKELLFVKSHPVICRIIIYDKAERKYHKVDSSPKLLIETASE
jgi:hypothetical protein